MYFNWTLFYRTHSAYGIMGFVRFLQGYYILLIKSRKRVAMVGQHCIYKIIVSFEIFVSNKFWNESIDNKIIISRYKNNFIFQ